MGLYNRFCKRFFAAVIIRLTAQSDSRAPLAGTGPVNLKVVPNECAFAGYDGPINMRLFFPHSLMV